MSVVFDPTRHCGAQTNPLNGATPCRRAAGWGTNHLGHGKCRLHGGTSPNHEKSVARGVAAAAVAKLGVPLGTGDPFVLLTKAVQHAEGFLEATGNVLAQAVDATDEKRVAPAAKRPALEAWASGRLLELASEYERSAAVH
jgi:hypothetical protein